MIYPFIAGYVSAENIKLNRIGSMMSSDTAPWQKQYRWVRTWPDDKGPDGKPPEDFSAYDGERYAGRIRLELANLKKGHWHWAGAHPKPFHGEPVMPNSGYRSTAAAAAETVETYWNEMKAKNLAPK